MTTSTETIYHRNSSSPISFHVKGQKFLSRRFSDLTKEDNIEEIKHVSPLVLICNHHVYRQFTLKPETNSQRKPLPHKAFKSFLKYTKNGQVCNRDYIKVLKHLFYQNY